MLMMAQERLLRTVRPEKFQRIWRGKGIEEYQPAERQIQQFKLKKKRQGSHVNEYGIEDPSSSELDHSVEGV